MTYRRITHAAIQVPDLIGAEEFYTTLFDTEVAFRETTIDDVWHTLSDDLDWEAAHAAGYQPRMSFIVRDELFLALETSPDGSTEENTAPYHLGLEMTEGELTTLLDRARETSCTVARESDSGALIEDVFGHEWDITTTWQPQRSGARTGNWITR